jgi:hypothetical protein
MLLMPRKLQLFLMRKPPFRAVPPQRMDEMIFIFAIPFTRLRFNIEDQPDLHIAPITIPPGNYKTAERLLECIVQGFEIEYSDMVYYLNAAYTRNKVHNPSIVEGELLSDNDKRLVKVFNHSTGEMHLRVEGFGTLDYCTIYFSTPIVLGALGIKDYRLTQFGYYAVEFPKQLITYPPNAISSSKIYLYCDVIKPQIVGNTMAPLLRSIKVPPSHNRGEVVNKEFLRPYYMRVWKPHISEIHIEMRDGQGKLITFQSGTSEAILHFRRCGTGSTA